MVSRAGLEPFNGVDNRQVIDSTIRSVRAIRTFRESGTRIAPTSHRGLEPQNRIQGNSAPRYLLFAFLIWYLIMAIPITAATIPIFTASGLSGNSEAIATITMTTMNQRSHFPSPNPSSYWNIKSVISPVFTLA
jgi:hypothetical protein